MTKYAGFQEVGTRTITALRRTMERHSRPMTVSELGAILGKSDPTIRAALRKSGAQEDKSVWPRVWSLPDMLDLTPQLGDSTDNVLVPVIHDDDWVTRWNKARAKFGADVGKLAIEPDTDPAKLYEDLLRGAKALSSLALAVQDVKDRPDWYRQLGGRIDEVSA